MLDSQLVEYVSEIVIQLLFGFLIDNLCRDQKRGLLEDRRLLYNRLSIFLVILRFDFILEANGSCLSDLLMISLRLSRSDSSKQICVSSCCSDLLLLPFLSVLVYLIDHGCHYTSYATVLRYYLTKYFIHFLKVPLLDFLIFTLG